MTAPEVAELLRVSVRTLREWRANRRGDVLDGPVFLQVGGRIRYRSSEVAAYLEANTTTSGGSA